MGKPVIQKNFIDKAIEFVAPQAAFNRMKARTAMALAGGYSGAKLDRAALSNWNSGAGSAEADISPDLNTLRSRARDLVRNTAVASGAVSQTTTNVVGTGLSLEPAPDAKFLNLTEDQSAQWIAAVKREWKLWANSKDVDLGRRMNFYQLQDLLFRARMESGDVFVLTPTKARGNVYDLCLQAIEADRICNPKRVMNSDKIIDGIEVDEVGAPLRAHISNRHPGDLRNKNMAWVAVDFYGKNNRRNILHLFKPLRPGQVRGVPDFSPLIELIKQLGTYTNAELQAAVTSAMFSMFVKMDAEGFRELFDDEAASALVKDGGRWDGNLDNGGRAVNLLPGEEVQAPNLGRPNSEFDPFVQSILRQIGMSLEIPYEVLIMHFQSSYSAARAAILSAWRTYRKWRDWMSTEFCQPVYELWLDEAVAKGRISAPGYFASPLVRSAWANALWIGDGPGSIDPVKDVSAAKERVALGISTRAAESILHDGVDWETKHAQLLKEKKMRDEAGLTETASGQPLVVNSTIDNNN